MTLFHKLKRGQPTGRRLAPDCVVDKRDCGGWLDAAEALQLAFGRKFDGKVVIALDGRTFVGHSVRVLRSQHSGDYVLFSTAIHTQQPFTADRCMPSDGMRLCGIVRSLVPNRNQVPFNLS